MNINQKIVSVLKKKKLTISFAESCTGGMLSNNITSVSGSSKIFSMGLVTYSNQSKTIILKISKKLIKKYGAVSIQCCSAMVNNLSKISKSKICVSTTGITGPTGGTKEKPVGLVFIGIKLKKKVYVHKIIFKNRGRKYIQKKIVKKIFELLIKLLNV
jgi:nicotinamide-nucleotide amidase